MNETLVTPPSWSALPRPLRIAHVTATFPPYWAGTGNVAYHNARLMHERGHHITVFTAQTSGEKYISPPSGVALTFPFRVVRLPAPFRLGNAPFTPGLLSGLQGFDLIHLHYPYIFGAELAWLASRLYSTPLLFTYHNRLQEHTPVKRELFGLYNALIEPLIFLSASRILAVRKEHLLAQHPGLRKDPRVREASNGVDTRLFSPGDPLEARRALGVSAQTPVALFVGALDPAHRFKNVDGLIRAFARVRVPAAELWVVGEGGLRAELEGLAGQLGLKERVRFLGKRTPDELPALYRAADVSVLPSTGVESFGLVLIESLACATPVIASALPGVRTLVTDGVDGHLVAPGDELALAEALELRLRERKAGQAMGQKGREKVLRLYDWEVIGEQLEHLYREVVSEWSLRFS